MFSQTMYWRDKIFLPICYAPINLVYTTGVAEMSKSNVLYEYRTSKS
jgi:hypothetical protein